MAGTTSPPSPISETPVALSSRYVEACEKHGLSPHVDIQNAILKAKHGVLKFDLKQLTETEILPLADVLSHVENSEWNAVDVVHNKQIAYGQMLLRVLRVIGSKLRLVDFKRIMFDRDVLRDLFHRGMPCQILDLSFSRVHKLDMVGQFPQLHTLILDSSMHLTALTEGCFRAMPNLAKLSMCDTRVGNLWTTCAVLSKVSSLVELRFQSCGCCEGTGICSSVSTSEASYLEDITPIRNLANIWHRHPMHIDDFGILDSEGSESSTSDGCDFDDIFSDDDYSTMMLHHVHHTSSEVFSGDSEGDFEGHLVDPMSIEDDLNYQHDGDEPTFDVSDVFSVQNEHDPLVEISNHSDELLSEDAERNPYSLVVGPEYFCIEGESSADPEETRINRFPLTTDPGTSANSVSVQSNPFFSRRGRFHHISRICYEKYYREFIIARLPGLKVLDNIPLTLAEREKARSVFLEHFEVWPNNCSEGVSIVDVLKNREAWSWMFPFKKRRRLGIAGSSSTGLAFTRSICALKMSSCAWPSCVPICKDKKATFQLNRKCRPRQFEYHPTDPSLMVFGTLHGEVVVINHESDKIVGHVQSNSSTHSILGLCWLNKDPNKLIAGSDDGSLQLYDVNRMRSTRSPGQIRRNPAIYTYENFDQLTSVHINCTDEYFLASGYSRNVGLYDLCTGKQLQIFTDLHQQHINVVKFAHHSPNLFTTSSFDKEIKMWDLRQRASKPLYTVRSTGGNVMVCFSRDDFYLLSSAVDNEVRQHLAVDGRLHMKLDIPPSGSSQNYTRSYYMNGRDYIISGSCEENVVRVYSAQTGRHLRDLALEGRCSRNSIYVQSLRGDPFRDFHFSVLAAYFQPRPKSEILKVNLLASNVHRKSIDTDSQHKLPAGLGA